VKQKLFKNIDFNKKDAAFAGDNFNEK